jgi:hypothetical protein
MPARDPGPGSTELELSQRGKVEGVAGETIAVVDGFDLVETTLGSLVLSDRDRTV